MNFKEVLNKMEDTYTRKNTDYGDSFKLSLEEHGLIASIIQMEHKFNRLKNLLKNKQQVEDESIVDTLLDLANYSAMSYMWVENKKGVDYKGLSFINKYKTNQIIRLDNTMLQDYIRKTKGYDVPLDNITINAKIITLFYFDNEHSIDFELYFGNDLEGMPRMCFEKCNIYDFENLILKNENELEKQQINEAVEDKFAVGQELKFNIEKLKEFAISQGWYDLEVTIDELDDSYILGEITCITVYHKFPAETCIKFSFDETNYEIGMKDLESLIVKE